MPDVIMSIDDLKSFISRTFISVGVPKEDTDIVVDVLISSDLRGIESHGIGRLKYYLNFIEAGVQKTVTRFEIVKESPGTALIDGHCGMGHVIAYRAMQIAIDKAAITGVAAVAVRNSSHFGIAGYYPKMALKRDMACFAFTNARPAVVPTFGSKPMFGTNPIAFGVPTDEECPFILDMATPITQRGKIEVMAREEKPVPSGWAIDREGNAVTDANALLEMFLQKSAALLPLGGAGELLAGYKGYGLALMVEILSSAFSGGPFSYGVSGVGKNGQKVPTRLGHFFIVIDISKFIDIDEFKKITGGIVRTMRESDRLPGQDRIYTSGEKEFELEQRIPAAGVPINENLQIELKEMQKKYGIEQELPF
jgi:LDH2 family malate/lactate/ureidoglycolate dehydrogenase